MHIVYIHKYEYVRLCELVGERLDFPRSRVTTQSPGKFSCVVKFNQCPSSWVGVQRDWETPHRHRLGEAPSSVAASEAGLDYANIGVYSTASMASSLPLQRPYPMWTRVSLSPRWSNFLAKPSLCD